jgi:hypothetical protein
MKRVAQLCGLGFLFFLLAEIPAWSQYGRLPGGSSSPGRSTYPGGSKQSGSQKGRSTEVPLANFTGVLKGMGGKTLTLEEAEANVLQFYCSRKTKYYDGSKTIKPSVLKPGDHLSVEAKRRLDGSLDAVNVHLEREKP